jgi:anti-sigma regulatory factor (Ser/Thr protein kinase)
VAQVAVAVDNARLYADALRATEQAQREIAERRRAEETLARQARFAALRADVSAALAVGGPLREMLQRCAEPLVDAFGRRVCAHLDAGQQQEPVLVLQASAGLYTHLDGAHSRIPVGQKKIGWIAQQKQPHLTNDVLGDERIADKEWARREGMVAFAGYPLLVEDRVVGVVALFARHTLSGETLDALASVAGALAQGVERKQVEQRLAESEARQRGFLQDALASVTGGRLRLCESVADLPERLPAAGERIALSRTSLRAARCRTRQAAQSAGLDEARTNDLLTAVGEAVMNAVTHAREGTADIRADEQEGLVQVWVEDRGEGIEVNHLPQATLKRGYTTAGTLGHGFKMMLQTADRLWLLTGPRAPPWCWSKGARHRFPTGCGNVTAPELGRYAPAMARASARLSSRETCPRSGDGVLSLSQVPVLVGTEYWWNSNDRPAAPVEQRKENVMDSVERALDEGGFARLDVSDLGPAYLGDVGDLSSVTG